MTALHPCLVFEYVINFFCMNILPNGLVLFPIIAALEITR